MLRMERKGVLCEGRVVIERDGFAQGGIDPPEHGEHDRDGFRRGLSREPRGEGYAGFWFMQDQHRPRALADDEVALPVTNIGAAFDVPWPIVDGGAVFDHVA